MCQQKPRVSTLFNTIAIFNVESKELPRGQPPGPEPDHNSFLNLGKKEGGEVFCFQRLAKALIGADSKKLKMRRLPPTVLPYGDCHKLLFLLHVTINTNHQQLCRYTPKLRMDLRLSHRDKRPCAQTRTESCHSKKVSRPAKPNSVLALVPNLPKDSKVAKRDSLSKFPCTRGAENLSSCELENLILDQQILAPGTLTGAAQFCAS
jgi:hypothetical protein